MIQTLHTNEAIEPPSSIIEGCKYVTILGFHIVNAVRCQLYTYTILTKDKLPTSLLNIYAGERFAWGSVKIVTTPYQGLASIIMPVKVFTTEQSYLVGQ